MIHDHDDEEELIMRNRMTIRIMVGEYLHVIEPTIFQIRTSSQPSIYLKAAVCFSSSTSLIRTGCMSHHINICHGVVVVLVIH